MSDTYEIAGIEFRRRTKVSLTEVELVSLDRSRRALVRRDVEWPVPDTIPDFASAYVDTGGTDIWGPGPYLKVPNRPLASDDDWVSTNRLFCPWGYPPDQLLVEKDGRCVALTDVALEHQAPDRWTWVLELTTAAA